MKTFLVNPKCNKINDYVLQFYNDDNWLQNTSYLLIENHNALIIDPSFLGDHLLKYCQKNNLKIQGILLTHGHWDHWILSRKLMKFAQVPVYCHSADIPILKVSLKRIREMDPNFSDSNLVYDLIEFQNWKDNDQINFNNFYLTTLHTPGHTPGSTCFIYKDCVFSGDHVFAETVGYTHFYLGDNQKMLASIQKFIDFCQPNQLVLCGHLDKLVFVEQTYPFLKKLLKKIK